MRKLIIAAALFLSLAGNVDAVGLFTSSTIYWENDNFGIGRKSDRFYTNGVRFAFTLADNTSRTWPRSFREAFCNHVWCGESKANEVIGVFLGQNFYTPEIITIAAPQPQDRPWAGVLYAGLSETITDDAQRVQHTFEAFTGVLGPGAGAQGTQKFVHNDLGFSNNDPQGWHNQLRNEPTFDLFYRRSHRFFIYPDPESTDSTIFDATSQFGGMLGTLQTYANVGGMIRLGYHITGFPIGIITNAAAPLHKPYKIELYLFAGVEGRWIPFNATLDGGFFRNGPKANDPKRFVGDLRVGVSARYKKFRLTYSVVDRSPEFKVPPGHIGTQRFGSYALTFEPFNDFQ